MLVSDRYLIVVSLTKGRNFPNRPRSHLVSEAKFDGEVLCTDPVPHNLDPEINQELAWELDRKGLQQHRLQRTAIKLVLYAVDNDSPVKESVGYVLLDVRSAANNKNPRWYPILHSKYAKTRPELSIAVYLDTDGQEVVPLDGAVPPKSGLASSMDPKAVRPILHTDELGAYYQIGAEKLCRDAFVLSVSLFSAGNLFALLPSSVQLSATTQGGFHFHYSVLGSPVNSESFGDLLCSEFPAERSSVRIRSSPDLLRVYFTSEEPKLLLQLVCGEMVLGKCEVPLFQLMKSAHDNLQQAAIVEGVYSIAPRHEEVPGFDEALQHDANKPWVALSVVLRREKTLQPPLGEALLQAISRKMQAGLYSPESRPVPAITATTSEGDAPSRSTTKGSLKPPPSGGYQASAAAADEEVRAISEYAAESTMHQRSTPSQQPRRANSAGNLQECCVSALSPATGGGGHDTIGPPGAHRFCYTIELRTVANLSAASHTLHVYARYVYPLFGSAAPLITHPPVAVRGKSQVNLPQGFCAFEFAATEVALREHLRAHPLVVEIYSREKSRQEDQLLGVAEIPLLSVLKQKLQQHASYDSLASVTAVSNVKKDVENISEVLRRAVGGVVPIQSHSGTASRPIGELSYHLCLEDFGLMSHYASDPNLAAKYSASQQQHLTQRRSPGTNRSGMSPGSQSRNRLSTVQETFQQQQQQSMMADTAKQQREKAEFQTALELELWKEEQERAFKASLQEKERVHMLVLAEEWARRDKEREILVKRKVAEYQELEEMLQATLRDLAERERRLEQAEMEVARQRQEASREHASVLAELRAASQRVTSEGEQRLELEKERTQHWKQRAEEWQLKFGQVEKEFARYRDRQEHSSEAKLQSELAHAKMDLLDMEKRLDEVSKAKMHYKNMWAKAMKELARIKQREEVSAKENLKRQEMELEHMRLRYLGNEEAQLVSKGQLNHNGHNSGSTTARELDNIKKELDLLRDEAEQKQQQQQQQSAIKLPACGVDEHVAQLIEERDNLLRTGVYSTQDEMIQDLDRQIRRCLEVNGRG